MRRAVDDAKRRLWRERLGRFARSGQTVAAFCSAEDVSVPTFYQWKRRLAAESVRWRRRRAATSSSVTRVRSSSSVKRGATCGSLNGAARSMRVNRAGAFLPVRIEGATLVEMELPNGARVRVPSGELAALGAAIAAAGRIPARVEVETPRC
jgi:hypothetical protein